MFTLGGECDEMPSHFPPDQRDSAGKDDDAFQMTLDGEENIFSLPALSPDTVYYWRVDARRGDNVFKGDTWSFGAI